MSSGYDPTDKTTPMFFAETQNKLLYAEFDVRRKASEAELADKQDVEEIEAIIKAHKK